MIMMDHIIDILLADPDPLIRYRAQTELLGQSQTNPNIQALLLEVRTSPVVTGLLTQAGSDGKIPHHPYKKWDGAHWILAALAEMHYPPGDARLIPLREQQYAWFFGEDIHHPQYQRRVITLENRARMCASMEGNAILSSLAFGLTDQQTVLLVERLLDWQWPDGGWNCDKKPPVTRSSFMETLIPMRALHQYAIHSGDSQALASASRAAEIFLKRNLFRRIQDGKIMDRHFIELFFPYYWHYSILPGLKAMAEIGMLSDPRCIEALDLLESKRLPNGGFPAEMRYYNTTKPELSGFSIFDWGGTSKTRMNPFVTIDALSILKSAGRWQPT